VYHPGYQKPDGSAQNYKRYYPDKCVIHDLNFLLSLAEIEDSIDHPKQHDRESENQENTVEIVSPDLRLYADVGH
jgi:hypothetical protein